MKATKVKQDFEAIKSYISAMHMRVDDENITKARNIIAFLNTRIAECEQEIAKEAAKEAEENKAETEA